MFNIIKLLVELCLSFAENADVFVTLGLLDVGGGNF